MRDSLGSDSKPDCFAVLVISKCVAGLRRLIDRRRAHHQRCQSGPRRSDNRQLLVHPIRVMISQVADQLVPTRCQRDRGPADRDRFNALAPPTNA